jgi:hypothetical protein
MRNVECVTLSFVVFLYCQEQVHMLDLHEHITITSSLLPDTTHFNRLAISGIFFIIHAENKVPGKWRSIHVLYSWHEL